MRKPPPMLYHFFPLCSPGSSTTFGEGVSYLTTVYSTESFNPMQAILDPDADPNHHQKYNHS